MTKVYVVNMRSSSSRRKFMESQLTHLGIEHAFVEAVDASALSQRYVNEINANRTHPHELRPAEIACSMSHVKALRTAISDGTKHFLVLEDDVILGKQLPNILERLSSCRDQGDVILLCALIFSPVHLTKREHLSGSCFLHDSDDLGSIFGSQAYWLSRDTAAHLVEALVPVRTTADDWRALQGTGIDGRVRLLFPFPVQHAEFLSDINVHKGETVALRTRLKLFFYERQLFPFYHLFLALRQRKVLLMHKKNISVDGKSVTKIHEM